MGYDSPNETVNLTEKLISEIETEREGEKGREGKREIEERDGVGEMGEGSEKKRSGTVTPARD